MLIDSQVPSYQTFVDSANSSTFPIVYSIMSSKTELLSLLQQKFTNILKIGMVFSSSLKNPVMFLDFETLFQNNEISPYCENVQFIINVIKEFKVKTIDFLACNTLNYCNWNKYYSVLTQETGVIVGASNDKTGNIKYGGDWTLETTNQDIELVYFTKSIEYYTYLLDNTDYSWISNQLSDPAGIAISGDYAYVANISSDSISKILLSNGTVSQWVTAGLSGPFGIAISGDYAYVTHELNNSISKILLSNGTVSQWVTSDLSGPFGIAISGDYAYVTNVLNNNSISKILLSNGTVSQWVTAGLSGSFGIAISGDYVYVTNALNNSISKISLPPSVITTGIDVNSVFTKTYGDIPFNLNVISNSDSPITYVSLDNSIVVVGASGIVTVIGSGSAFIELSQVATNTYSSASTTVKIIVEANTPSNPTNITNGVQLKYFLTTHAQNANILNNIIVSNYLINSGNNIKILLTNSSVPINIIYR